MARTKVLHLSCRDVRPIGWIIRQSPEVLFELLGGVADHLVEQEIAGVVAIEADHRRIAINRERHAHCAAGAAWIGVHIAVREVVSDFPDIVLENCPISDTIGRGTHVIDRKSGVKGKSVSVRLDHGVRRIIKKKSKYHRNSMKCTS